MMCREQTAKRWKFLLLIGKPTVVLGMGLVGVAVVTWRYEFAGLGVLLIALGFVAAWTGRIGGYWFYG